MFSRRKSNSLGNSTKEKINWEYYNPPEDSIPANFCLDSSLHGIQYIGQQDRHSFERILWLAAFIGSVACAGLLIHQLWEAYSDSPILTVFSPEETLVKDIAFPSVTICNVNKIKMSKREEYIRELETSKNPFNEKSFLKALAAIHDLKVLCGSTFTKQMVNETDLWYENFTPDLEKRKDDYEQFINPAKILVDSSQKCDEMLVQCTWQGMAENCSKFFHPIVTDYGYCCSFNNMPPTLLMKDYNETQPDSDYAEKWKHAKLSSDDLAKEGFREEGALAFGKDTLFRQTYPSRASGLSVMLEPNLKEYSCTSTDSEGFMVGLNVPLSFPRMKDDGILVQSGAETIIKINPQITVSEESVKKFAVSKRKCYFDGEGENELPHYSKYTASNCFSECLFEYIRQSCGCFTYYMPKNSEILPCSSSSYECVIDKEMKSEVDIECTKANRTPQFEDPACRVCSCRLTSTFNARKEDVCKPCYQTCTDINYQAQVTSLRIRKQYLHALLKNFPVRNTSEDAAIVHFYFGQQAYQTRLRKETYSVIDLISSSGGLLGLCMGFSMLSVLEIVYYFTIRLCFIYRRKYIEKQSTREKPEEHSHSDFSSGGSQSRPMKMDNKNKAPVFKITQRGSTLQFIS